jgi:hypothetical protein
VTREEAATSTDQRPKEKEEKVLASGTFSTRPENTQLLNNGHVTRGVVIMIDGKAAPT